VHTARSALRWAMTAALLVLLWPAPAAAQEPQVLLARIQGPITPVIAAHVSDAIDEAVANDYDAVLFEMDTPGGLVTSMREIVQDLLGSPVPVVVYVSPSGSSAASAGAVITFASHIAAMAPATNIGAATPIGLEGGEVLDKVVEDAVAYVTAIAEERDRDVEFAVDTVREGRSASASEALEVGAIDLIVDSRTQLLSEIDGETVTLSPDGEEVTLSTAGAAVIEFDMSWTRRLLQSLADPQLAFMFLSIGSLALLYELANPGGGLGGVLGVIMIVLAFFALSVLPVNFVGVLLLVLAIALFVTEMFVPGVGVFAGGGAIALVVAGLFLFDRPTGIGLDLSFLLPIAAVAGIGAAPITRLAWRTRTAPAYTGVGGELVGALGTVRSAAGETPQVWVNGALWKAPTAKGLAPGTAIRVVDIHGMELEVEPAQEPAPHS
jgi:membrane-bound serine protease (ClpP class)